MLRQANEQLSQQLAETIDSKDQQIAKLSADYEQLAQEHAAQVRGRLERWKGTDRGRRRGGHRNQGRRISGQADLGAGAGGGRSPMQLKV